ncbi:hypothetical protein [Microbacterium pumilum]|uniref:Peptidase M28 domain-containing protein n=1 Tax=Microbacterium pumilum TaxID=344165 RepID=A0ABP5EGG3_9MICO
MNRIHPDDFISTDELARWQQDLDDRGLRATGSAEHASYIADLADRLEAAGVRDVHLEPIPFQRWAPRIWSLQVDGTDVPVTSYASYSGSTGPQGVAGPLSAVPTAGTIGVIQVTPPVMPSAMFDSLDWGAPALPLHAEGYNPNTPYKRLWLPNGISEQLVLFEEAGAAGLILVIDLPEEQVRGGYLVYDGVFRDLPTLIVSGEAGAAILNGTDAHLTLDAEVVSTITHNVVGTIPGRSDELVVLQSHTDGTNGVEDNGPEAIIAMAEHLARRDDLARGVVVLLSAGHFAIELAWGVEAWLAAHKDDLVPKVAAAICLEHLGALPSRSDVECGTDVSPYEFGAFFSSPHPVIIDLLRASLDRAEVTESLVLRPFVPLPGNPAVMMWPGDGGPFWHTAGLPAGNFITGPDYLLNVEPVMEFIDVDALRRQAIAFTELILDLTDADWDDLHRHAPLATVANG